MKFRIVFLFLIITATACVAPVIHEDIEDREVIYPHRNNPLVLFTQENRYGYQHTPAVFYIAPNEKVQNAALKITVLPRGPAAYNDAMLYLKLDDLNRVIPGGERTGKGERDIKGSGVLQLDGKKRSLTLDFSALVVAEHEPGVQGSHVLNWISQLKTGAHRLDIWVSEGENTIISAELAIEYAPRGSTP